MNDDFITYELAKKLKEKGFDAECLCHYVGEDLVYNIESPITNNQLWFSHNKFDNIWHRDNYDAPTISQVLKWLRDKKNIYCLPYFEQGIDMWLYAICKPAYGCEFPEFISKSDYDTYEQAALAGIEYVLDNLI
jgi:hypothetical protein